MPTLFVKLSDNVLSLLHTLCVSVLFTFSRLGFWFAPSCDGVGTQLANSLGVQTSNTNNQTAKATPEVRNELLVTIGGSHRKTMTQHRAFESAGIPLRGCGAFQLGSKLRSAIMPDTAEARELLKKVGGRIAKQQWSWLKKDNQ